MTETATFIRNSIKDLYSPEETRALVRLIMERVCGITTSQLLLGKGKEISDKKKSEIKQIVKELRLYKPIQYILGETEFYGLTLKVNRAVLIPRPETAELVDRIVHDFQGQSPYILDIGTGSGCIAIALAKHLPLANVSAIDVSPDALIVASENAEANKVHVIFHKIDILSEENQLFSKEFDCIVSNPPYVMEKEKAEMEANVLNYEPHQALFVPDKDPLLYYRAIAKIGKKCLANGGKLYVEINALLGKETVKLLHDEQYKYITCMKDLYGKERFIKATI